ncbi:PH domain-containing protein [Streptomyces chiangmaiensis]|uniref:PH domain-containing protein n=1 Tax=Streptomyces chiangmaiensis TaxID=766497 RepID=A0ABU7FC85_9ACTN|nr:PH domain-containing protein [Streptomyces chiangmaiensis]MED7821690.1 PH domain-containing protein [Streptomyces chiangmaiensis]
MTTPDHQSPAPDHSASESQDRVYRSHAGIAAGVLLLGLVLWLGIDALVSAHGRAPWLALAALILVVPAVAAFTVRPAVFTNHERLRIRNPLRVIVLPWGSVASFRSTYSNEVLTTSGTKYQLWAIPVSLRARKKAARQQSQAATRAARAAKSGRTDARSGVPDGPSRAQTDQVMDDLRELFETHGKSERAQGEPTVRWAYEVIGPVVAGAVLLAVLLAIA